ncbi:MAG: hypothetical protein ACYS29_14955, partial [Planctomycetota bacterium]
MTIGARVIIMIVVTVFGSAGSARSQALSIYEIQYTTDPNGASPQNGNIVDCLGGIVIHKSPPPTRPRVTLYDPNYPDGWGGIIAKDLDSAGVFDDVNLGEWVSFTNVQVEDFKGTTFLQYTSQNDPNFAVVSTNNPLPRPLMVSADDIAAPV